MAVSMGTAGLLMVLIAPLLAAELRFSLVGDDVLRRRLSMVEQKNEDRAEAVRKIFEEAGCKDENLRLEPVRAKWSNVVCLVPGESDGIIVVGAHFDHVRKGTGAVDNWSGASLLSSLYQTIRSEQRKFTYVFVGFAEEEKGLIGANAFVKRLGSEGLPKVHAMINIDSIGMNPPKIWVHRSDKRLVQIAAAVGESLDSQLQGIDVQKVGDSDSRPFSEKKIPVLDVHSLTQQSLGVLHSVKDVPEAVSFEHYKSTYKFVAALLVYLDRGFDRYQTPQPEKASR